MAIYLNSNAAVSVNGTDLSDHAFSLDLPQVREQIDASAFNSGGYKSFLPGGSEETATVGFRQDFAASKVHAVLEPLYSNQSTFALIIKPVNTTVSSTNPAFQGTAALFEYNGISAGFGEVSSISAVFKSADPSAPLAWATA